jgi:hypothetical protein
MRNNPGRVSKFEKHLKGLSKMQSRVLLDSKVTAVSLVCLMGGTWGLVFERIL